MSWVIKAKYAPPHASIIKDVRYSGVQIGGELKEPGGPYYVNKGDTIYVYATVKNTGEQTGALWVAIWDRKTGRLLASAVDSVASGGTLGIPTTPIVVEHDMEIYIEAGIGTVIGQNKTDEWGC